MWSVASTPVLNGLFGIIDDHFRRKALRRCPPSMIEWLDGENAALRSGGTICSESNKAGCFRDHDHPVADAARYSASCLTVAQLYKRPSISSAKDLLSNVFVAARLSPLAIARVTFRDNAGDLGYSTSKPALRRSSV